MISDHALICFVVTLKKPSVKAQWVNCRAWRQLSRDAFASDLEASDLCAELDALADKSFDDLVQLYRDVLTGLLDKHCPVVKMRRRPKKATPWFDANCRAVRRHTRAAERRFRRTRSSEDKLVWDRKMKLMRSLYNDKYTTVTGATTSDQRQQKHSHHSRRQNTYWHRYERNHQRSLYAIARLSSVCRL